MANVVYSKTDEALILGMKTNKKGRPTDSALNRTAKKLGKTTGAIYQKWNALKSRPPLHTVVTSVTPVVETVPVVKATPMVFPEVDFILMDSDEEANMIAGLDSALRSSFSNGKSIVVPSGHAERARSYLTQLSPNSEFVISPHPDMRNKTEKIISKKN